MLHSRNRRIRSSSASRTSLIFGGQEDRWRLDEVKLEFVLHVPLRVIGEGWAS